MKKGCFFCQLYQMKKEAVIAESEHFFSMYDENPVNPGHVLIISKRHTPSLFDLDKAEFSDLFTLLAKAKEAIQQHHPDGYNIGINDGPAAGQTVFHLHIHIIPRYQGDVKNPRGGVRGVIPEKRDYPSVKK
jgi:diadenosine tetraphosphate (Ap4A) HIT family hydrolase